MYTLEILDAGCVELCLSICLCAQEFLEAGCVQFCLFVCVHKRFMGLNMWVFLCLRVTGAWICGDLFVCLFVFMTDSWDSICGVLFV